MARVLLAGILCLLFVDVRAQETVVWASSVVEVSSEFSPLEYSASQALSKPNVLPNGGDNPNAWNPRKPDRDDEWIKLAFDKPINAQQIVVAESQNPGAVKAVYAYDANNTEYLLFEITPRDIPLESRLLNIFFEMTPYKVHAVRILMDCSVVPGFNSIDAVGISDSNIPINVLINIARNVNQDLETEKLDENINSSYVEHGPLLSPDGKILFFSRQNHPDNVGGFDDVEDIWFSRLNEETGEWMPAQNAGPPLNTPGANFVSSITEDENGIVLLLGNRYEKNGKMRPGVSIARLTADSTWSEPEKLDVTRDYNNSVRADYFISQSMDVLLMSVQRDDTYGRRDLHVSFKEKDGKWSEPLNLGPAVNTANDEKAPFLAEDDVTLYFSSKGFSGFGGSDIYVSKRLDDTWTNWSEPENLGSGINTNNDDVYFNFPSAGIYAYFTRGQVDENTDIFRFKRDDLYISDTTGLEDVVVVIRGKVYNGKTNEPIVAKVITERLPDGISIGETASADATGEYEVTVRYGALYGLIAEADGFIAREDHVDLNETVEGNLIEKDLFLMPIERQAVFTFNNIFFDFDKTVLKTASYAELNRVLKLLQSGEVDALEIRGHTDSTGPASYNLSLSEKRAKAVYDYFISQGIEKNRLDIKAFGETQPVVANDTRENRSINRRVEFKIIDKLKAD